MSTKFFALLTQLGADKLANAAALGTRIEITHMAVGDGGGKLPTPDTKQTKLINEKRRAAINTLSIDPKNTNQVIAEQVIPENEGGWWIREIGLFDKDGILIAVGNCAETYKPQLQEGSGRTQTIRMILIVSSADAVTLKVDPSVILATREYVDDSIKKHANSRNHPDATLKEKGFVILSSAMDSNSETHAATPKAVKAAYDFANAANNNANGRLEKNKNGADVADKDAFNHNIGSGRAFSGEVTIGGGGTWTTEEFIAWLKSKGAFNHPYWMCKGTWAYASNRRITNTGCGSIHLAGAVVEVMGIESVMTIRVTTAPTSVDGCIPNAQFTYGNHGKDYLPSWRRDYNTINKPTSDEVGAYSKSETDIRVNEAKDLANTRLEKSKNGADIPNKDEFVKNLGLTETKTKADNALPRSGGNVTGDITITTDTEIAWRRNTDMAAIGFKNTGDGDADSYMWFKTGDNGNEYFKWDHTTSGGQTAEWMSLKSDNLRVKGHQVYHEGYKPTAAIIGAYTKSEINNRFIPSNANAKTSGYILSKAANLYDDPNSRHLGRSGFLRPNGIDNLGSLAIHVAHPSTEGPEHARGISFNYGSSGDKFGLSTYAFDKDGKFQGQKKILTEDDKDSLGNVPVGVPLPWPQDKPPSGYLICNGGRFDKSRYPQLALAYPSGVLPDLRGEFIRGLDAGRNVDSGRKVLTSQFDCIQDHAHLSGVEGTFGFSVPQDGSHRNVPGGFKSNGGNTSTGPTNSNWNNIRIGTETRPRNIAFLYIVRAA